MSKKKPPYPEFKPGEKSFCRFGKEFLNKDVPWHRVVADIKEHNYSLSAIAVFAGTRLEVIQQVLQKNFNELSFRVGAKLISLHFQLCPEHYPEVY
jgi:lambda repressor-like predicted transcriptional regulator